MMRAKSGLTALAFALMPAAATAQQAPATAALQARMGIVTDHDEIERLHNIYGYQQDYMLYMSQADLNSRDAEHHYKYGIYRGIDGSRRMWHGRFGGFTGYADMPTPGALIDHHQAQGIITIAPDRQTAKARFRTSADRFYSRVGTGLSSGLQAAEGADHAVWYENSYKREDGIWKLSGMRVCIYAEGAFGSGYADLPVPGKLGVPADAGPDYWKTRARTRTDPRDWNTLYPKAEYGPDEVETPQAAGCFFTKNATMVHSVVLPFHFPNPVTGKDVKWRNH